MIAAIDHRQISPEQYSKPQCSAVAHGINRRLAFDYQQYLRQPFSLACSDLKIWYDQIVHSAARLALQRLGINILSMIIIFDTIQRMSHTFRVAYGDSNIMYGGDIISDKFSDFMMGIFQRNSSAPQIWLIIRSVVFSQL